MEISYNVAWRRDFYIGNYFRRNYIYRCYFNGKKLSAQSGHNLECLYGCSSTLTITAMSFTCTDFSIEDNWTFGERILSYTFTQTVDDIITIGFTGGDWIKFNRETSTRKWNVSTTFSLATRNDTGKINSSPRVLATPALRLQQGCNHTIPLAVSDPDGDIIRCRWAVGKECGGICGLFLGADLDKDSCTIKYSANRTSAVLLAAAIMVEDFVSGSLHPLSSVALQFLVKVTAFNRPCSQQPEFIDPTLPQGSCVAIPPGTTFTTQLTATSGSPKTSITEIQTASPLGTIKGELQAIPQQNVYYVNNTWVPTASQQNQTHQMCYTAISSERLASAQTCIGLLVGYYPPTPIPITATPNQQLVHPSNTTWHVEFDRDIQHPVIPSYIIFYEFTSELEVYRIDTSSSPEVALSSYILAFTPSYNFTERSKFYIAIQRGVVRSTEGCGAGNEPVTNKTCGHLKY